MPRIPASCGCSNGNQSETLGCPQRQLITLTVTQRRAFQAYEDTRLPAGASCDSTDEELLNSVSFREGPARWHEQQARMPAQLQRESTHHQEPTRAGRLKHSVATAVQRLRVSSTTASSSGPSCICACRSACRRAPGGRDQAPVSCVMDIRTA